MKTILLNPGPVTLTDRVRESMLGPDLCHREPEFADLQAEIRRGLLAVYQLPPDAWAAVLLTGSGTAAVEAMLTSFVPRTGKVLVLENGVYGERIAAICERHTIRYERLRHDWLEELDLTRIRTTVRGDPAISHVAVVHHETTTGRLNDLAPLASLCREHGAELLLDGVSSFGAEEINFEQWPIAAVAATANKCLHGVPGTCFVIVRRDALAAAQSPKRTVYFDLQTYVEHQDKNGTPFTQSVQTFYALAAALCELAAEGGWHARRDIYRARIIQVRHLLIRLGVRPLLREGASSCVLHAFELPQGLSYGEFHDALKARGFVIYAGQSTLAAGIFRISMMGAISPQDVGRLCAAFEEIIATAD